MFVTGRGIEVTEDNAESFRTPARRLGSGVSREVFAIDENYVIKFNRNRGVSYAGDNRSEVAMWNAVKDTPAGRFFCPVMASADDGSWLVMRRVTDIADNVSGKETHSFLYGPEGFQSRANSLGLSDLHRGNMGVLADGAMVVIDYAFNRGAMDNGSSLSDQDSGSCKCSQCNRPSYGTRTRRHNDGTTCGYTTCEQCHGTNTRAHRRGTCGDTYCDECHPFGHCQADDCFSRAMVLQHWAGTDIALCQHHRPVGVTQWCFPSFLALFPSALAR